MSFTKNLSQDTVNNSYVDRGVLAQRADSQYEYTDQLLLLHSARMFFHYPEEGALQQRRVALKARMRRFRTRLGILGLRR